MLKQVRVHNPVEIPTEAYPFVCFEMLYMRLLQRSLPWCVFRPACRIEAVADALTVIVQFVVQRFGHIWGKYFFVAGYGCPEYCCTVFGGERFSII